jgi:hypothetical protein
MMTNLFLSNTPVNLWRCLVDLTEEQLQLAVKAAAPFLQFPDLDNNIDNLLQAVLGEGQFGPNHWRLSPTKRFYYSIKPFLPRSLTLILRRLYSVPAHTSFPLRWPIEDRYVQFQWEIVQKLLQITGRVSFQFVHFWPYGHRFAFVLTHDIETAAGQAHVRMVADLEEGLGFRSSFNFVPERYRVDHGLMQELRVRGFEIGVHGLKHDGKLFRSKAEFIRRSERINDYLKEFGAVGFRAPLTHRQPEWMQLLEIEYDSSFFDTDPYEPMPGGTMSIWPFTIGRFVELPYTLVQDYTLTTVLKEKTPHIWLKKIDFIRDHCGMALLNTHPDYLKAPDVWRVYVNFLEDMIKMNDCWHALPRDVARWWQARAAVESLESLPGAVLSETRMFERSLIIEPQARNPPTQ